MKENDSMCEASVGVLLNSCDDRVTTVTTPELTDNKGFNGCKVVSGSAS